MQDFLNKVVELSKKFIMPIMLVLIGLNVLQLLLDIIAYANYGGEYIAYLVVAGVITIAILGYAIFAWSTGKTERFKLFAVIYFAYVFLNAVYSVPALIITFAMPGAVSCACNVFEMIKFIAYVVIGALIILDYLNKTEKFTKIINWILAALIVWLFIILILKIVAVCVEYAVWSEIVYPIVDMAFLAFFCALFNYKKGASQQNVAEEQAEVPEEQPVE